MALSNRIRRANTERCLCVYIPDITLLISKDGTQTQEQIRRQTGGQVVREYNILLRIATAGAGRTQRAQTARR